MALVSITRLRVRSWRYIPRFYLKVLRSALQARAAEQSMVVALFSDRRNTYWTCTVWRDEASMRSFMVSGAHRDAMPSLQAWCDEASVVHWVQDSDQAPTWEEAHQRMQTEGRQSRVSHPSVAHVACQIPPPRVRAVRVLHFKRQIAQQSVLGNAPASRERP
jgi:hypothetical protein